MTWEIPLRLLPLRATVHRFNAVTGEYDNEVYADLPCRIALHRDNPFRPQERISSEVEVTLLICNHKFDGTPIDLRFEDRATIGTHKYRILKVSDAESAEHHLECRVEQLKTMSTPPN